MRFLILDRDSKFTAQFRRVLEDAGVQVVTTAYQAPDMNAFAERWVLSAKSECLNKMIFFGEQHLRRAIEAYVAHYNRDRPHQGLGNRRIGLAADGAAVDAEVVADERLGGRNRRVKHRSPK